MDENISYKEAYKELEGIVTAIETGNISIDELSDKVKRAAILIKICKTKLTTTGEDVQKIIKELKELENNS